MQDSTHSSFFQMNSSPKQRRVHLVTIQDTPPLQQQQQVGQNQYECILKRRAIRKRPDGNDFPCNHPNITTNMSPTLPVKNPWISKEFQKYSQQRIHLDDWMNTVHLLYSHKEEMEGDTSLGMKLTILGGKVIVQNVIGLEDGRASPAQITGLISRGDVLIAVDDSSLVGLASLERLIDRLKPLSAPMDDQGNFQRFVRLKFEIGQGLVYLEKEELRQGQLLASNYPDTEIPRIDAAEDLFHLSTFTFVDQWSGMPLYEDSSHKPFESSANIEHVQPDSIELRDEEGSEQVDVDLQPQQDLSMDSRQYRSLDLRALISNQLSKEWELQRQRHLSAYFIMDDTFSTILRNPVVQRVAKESHEKTWQERVLEMDKDELTHTGNELIRNAQVGYTQIERLLQDTIPMDLFTSKRAAWKLYRQRTKDAFIQSSMGFHIVQYLEDEDVLDFMTNISLWKDHLLQLIQSHSLHTDALESSDNSEDIHASNNQSMHGVITGPLQSLLFGSPGNHPMLDMKTTSFPPKDCTSILYIISKRIAAILYPSEDGSFRHTISNDKSTWNIHRAEADCRTIERQLLDDILPLWFHTFYPLACEHRMSIFSTDGEMTVKKSTEPESTRGRMGLAKESTIDSNRNERGVDPTIRYQTCYLVTFFLTRKILGHDLKITDGHVGSSRGEPERLAAQFVNKYGAYINLHPALVRAQAVDAGDTIISALLGIAKNDSYHLALLKKWNNRMLDSSYEPRMLSAIFSYVLNGSFEIRPTVTILTASFPDLLPSQVRRLLSKDQRQDEIYYEYLTVLMDPLKGHASVRNDPALVRDWCDMSASSTRIGSIDNFFKVASKSLGHWTEYYRDLAFLLEKSLKLDCINVSMDLCLEIIHQSTILYDEQFFASSLRALATKALNKDLHAENDMSFSNFSPLLTVYEDIQKSSWKHVITVEDELIFLFNICCSSGKVSSGMMNKIVLLMTLIAKSFPQEALSVISVWEEVNLDLSTGHILFQLLKVCMSSAFEYADFTWSKAGGIHNQNFSSTHRNESIWNRIMSDPEVKQ